MKPSPDRTTALYLFGTAILFFLLLSSTNQFLSPILGLRSSGIGNSTFYIKEPAIEIDSNKNYLAKIKSSVGIIELELCTKCAPKNVNNFIYLSKNNVYNNTKISRVVKDFMFQMGDLSTKNNNNPKNWGFGKTTYLIEDELNWTLLNITNDQIKKLEAKGYKSNSNLTEALNLRRFSVAMANNKPNSNSSQFFMVTADNSDTRLLELNGQFTVIGEIKSGFEVINTINNTLTNNDIPSTNIIVESISIE